LDRRFASENGCSRCDSVKPPIKAWELEYAHPGRAKRKGEGDLLRVDPTRISLTTGMGSAKKCEKIEMLHEDVELNAEDSLADVCVSVRGSKIHGWGLFADQRFKKGDVVTEYIGEYVANSVADAREKVYQERRIQDYQFRLDENLLIDATIQGGTGRYMNHNCTPNCYSKVIPGKEPRPDLKRVLFIALRDIDINEEITYDYQFPLEMNLNNRIPCNCQSDACRGFMNWDIPEKGSNNRALLIQKRGANMRDRIRRLGRPLKRDEGGIDE
jgi:histone-lysine N-methyltransferase SETD1